MKNGNMGLKVHQLLFLQNEIGPVYQGMLHAPQHNLFTIVTYLCLEIFKGLELYICQNLKMSKNLARCLHKTNILVSDDKS